MEEEEMKIDGQEVRECGSRHWMEEEEMKRDGR